MVKCLITNINLKCRFGWMGIKGKMINILETVDLKKKKMCSKIC